MIAHDALLTSRTNEWAIVQTSDTGQQLVLASTPYMGIADTIASTLRASHCPEGYSIAIERIED